MKVIRCTQWLLLPLFLFLFVRCPPRRPAEAPRPRAWEAPSVTVYFLQECAFPSESEANTHAESLRSVGTGVLVMGNILQASPTGSKARERSAPSVFRCVTDAFPRLEDARRACEAAGGTSCVYEMTLPSSVRQGICTRSEMQADLFRGRSRFRGLFAALRVSRRLEKGEVSARVAAALYRAALIHAGETVPDPASPFSSAAMRSSSLSRLCALLSP